MASSSAHGDGSRCISEADKVLSRIKRILHQMRPENIHVLTGQIINAGITSADILEGVICLVYNKVINETTFCPMYAELCCILRRQLPFFPPDEPDGKPISFRRILLNICQEVFESDFVLPDEMTDQHQESRRLVRERIAKLRMGNIRLIGELFKQKMIPEKIVHHCIKELLSVDKKVAPTEGGLELLCQLFKIVGKQLEKNPGTRIMIESYFAKMEELITDQNLPSGVRLMVRDVVHLRSNNWIAENEEVNAETLDMHLHGKMSFRVQSEAQRKSRQTVRNNQHRFLRKLPTDLDKW